MQNCIGVLIIRLARLSVISGFQTRLGDFLCSRLVRRLKRNKLESFGVCMCYPDWEAALVIPHYESLLERFARPGFGTLMHNLYFQVVVVVCASKRIVPKTAIWLNFQSIFSKFFSGRVNFVIH